MSTPTDIRLFLPSGWTDAQKRKHAGIWHEGAIAARAQGDLDRANACAETALGLECGVSAGYRLSVPLRGVTPATIKVREIDT
jgi:hypothetical protein